MSQVDQIAPNGIVQLGETPGGIDATFDSMFATDSNAPAAQPQQQQVATQQPPVQQQVAQPQTPAQQEFFIKGDQSVYKTHEDAVRGLNEKDGLVKTLRERYALVTGIDPITGRPVENAIQSQPPVLDYTQNPSKFMEDLYSAAKGGQADNYVAVQQKLVMDTLKPVAPLIQDLVRTKAINEVSKENAEASKFFGSEQFSQTMNSLPELKQAIGAAETDSRYYSQLPGLYKLAYLAGQAMNIKSVLQQQASQTPPPVLQPVRTSAQPSTPGLPSPQAVARPNLGTIEGIREVIRQGEARGFKQEDLLR